MHKSLGNFDQEARKKGQPIIAKPKARIRDKAKKKGDEAQTITQVYWSC